MHIILFTLISKTVIAFFWMHNLDNEIKELLNKGKQTSKKCSLRTSNKSSAKGSMLSGQKKYLNPQEIIEPDSFSDWANELDSA